jgi:uncharacterized protein
MKQVILFGWMLLGTLLAGAFLASGAHAANFECAKASTPMERTICASPDLSKADDRLAVVFKAALGGVSADGQTMLRANERQFRQFADDLCHSDGQDGGAACLEDVFSHRAEQLDHAVVRLGGRTFLPVSDFHIMPAGDGEAPHSHVLTRQQIDAPATPADRDWNLWAGDAVKEAYRNSNAVLNDTPVADVDALIRMDIAAASSDLIDVTLGVSVIDMRAYNSETSAIWLTRDRRELLADDLFDAGKPWATALAPVAQRHLESYTDLPFEAFATIRRIDEGGNWHLTPQGLRIDYPAFLLADNPASAATTLLSWAEMRPWLKSGLPFDPARIQIAPGR